MRLNKSIIALLVIGSLMGLSTLFYYIRDGYYKNIEVKLNVVKYLDNYHVWEGEFITTLYNNSAKECSKDKKHKYFGYTYSGVKAVPNRSVAVDPKVVTLGSILIDKETGNVYFADDTGNGVKGYWVDIYVGEGSQSNVEMTDNWGIKRRKFVVIEPLTKQGNILIKTMYDKYNKLAKA